MQTGAMTSTDYPEGTHLSEGQALVRRLRFLSGMAVAVVIFWYVGFWAARSNDPIAPITLVNVDQGVIAMAELLGLAVVASGLAVAICGPNSVERGALAIAIGLAAMGMRGSQIDKLILYRLDLITPSGPVAAFPTTALVAETWLWLALISVGFIVGRWVDSWYDSNAARAVLQPVDRAPDVRQGLGAVAVVSLVAWMVISYAIGGDETPLLKGQIYFAIALGFLVGSMVANWLFQLHSRAWLLCAVALVASAAYIFAGPDSATIDAARKAGSYITLRPVVRALPIEYAAMGAVGALLEHDVMALLRALLGLQPASR